MYEPDMIQSDRLIPRKDKNEPSVNASPGSVAVGVDNVKVGVGDIKNDKSVGEKMQVKDGEVNITVNNNNSKTVTNSLANRFNRLPDVPAVSTDNDISMEK